MRDLSIILPVFNGSMFLAEQIESILNQCHSEFELIIIDDGSTDCSHSIICDYVNKDNRIQYLGTGDNQGHRARLRQLWREASCNLVAFADQDDIWHPDRNAILLDRIGGNSVAFCRSELISESGSTFGRSLLEEHEVDAADVGAIGSLFTSLVSGHAAIVKREWLDESVFFSPIPFDWLIGSLALFTDGLIYDNSAIVYHRIHKSNQSNSQAVRSSRKLISLYKIVESTTFLKSDRLHFFLFLDELSRCPVVTSQQRLAFKRASDACRYAWYQPLKPRILAQGNLEKELYGILAPLCTSERDLDNFSARLRSITRSQFSLTNSLGAIRRYASSAW